MNVDYEFLESKYKEVRESIINVLVNDHKFSRITAIMIVDYENDLQGEYNQVKDLMEQDLIMGRDFNIQAMTERILDNDEGKYQSTIKLV
jgi:hypothetical protein